MTTQATGNSIDAILDLYETTNSLSRARLWLLEARKISKTLDSTVLGDSFSVVLDNTIGNIDYLIDSIINDEGGNNDSISK